MTLQENRQDALASSDVQLAKRGLRISRRFTTSGENPFDSVQYTKRSCRIGSADGKAVFEANDVEAPVSWSALAVDIMASKYFRKAGVPGTPNGAENSVKQPIHRLAQCWREWGENNGYFLTTEDAQIFYDECVYMMLHQLTSPNSPQWFNTGLATVYNINGPSQGHHYVDQKTNVLTKSKDSHTHPQVSACYIQSIRDDLVNEGGIMDLWVREARLFKYGSGTGTNFSNLRGKGERLSGGGSSSGLMSWLKIGDRAAGAIQSGGTTRRAAKMVCLDIDHPEVESFIGWKVEEEKKVAALIAAGYDSDFNGEAYSTVSGQNSNNSVCTPDTFLDVLKSGGDWHLLGRIEIEQARKEGRAPKPFKTVKALDLWNQIANAAWSCADPGLMYTTTMNDWHTCPKGGAIKATNPCAEYIFLDDTACNLASLNLLKFLKPDGVFDVVAFKHAVNIWTVVLEISVLMAQYPSPEIAQRSFEYRTIGLGYANLGTLLMCMGLPYDSDKGRAVAAAVTSIMTGTAYRMSAEMAGVVGHFAKYPENSADMMRVMRNHRRAAYNAIPEDYQGLRTIPQGLKPEHCPEPLYKAACEAWDEAVALGQVNGFRNAQATVIAPTGTIGLLMDCDTTGVEPDFAVVKFKKLAGGGSFKIVNQSVSLALRALGYDEKDIKKIIAHIAGTNTFTNAPHVDVEALLAKGLTLADVAKIENDLPRSSHLTSVFAPRLLGADMLKRVGVTEAKIERLLDKNSEEKLDVLEYMGFSKAQVAEADVHICGRQTIEGAVWLKPEHLAIFDCANRCGETGTRFIHYSGHIKMLGAVQPFVSGGISKTINMPNEATVDDIKRAYFDSHRLGVKAVALYRDGCKLSQVLSTGGLHGKVAAKKTLDVESLTPEELFKLIPPEKRVRKLPKKRRGLTYELKVGGHKIYLRTGEYANGDLGEIFLDVSKEGSTLRNILSCFAVSVSKGLQHSVPLRTFVDTFTLTKFDPAGVVEGHDNIKQATSIIDAVFRVLANDYLNDDELSQVKLGNSGGPVIGALPVPVENDDTQIVRTMTKESFKKKSVEANPLCVHCGGLTIRTGTCHVCSSCGTSQGCS